MRFAPIVLGALFLLSANCQSIPIDEALGADEGNEASVILCGLGEGCRKGMLFAQRRAGTDASDVIRLSVPKIKCDRRNCVDYQIFNPDGSQGHSGGIKKGSNEATFRLSDVIDSMFVRESDDKEWLIRVRVYYLDNDKIERTTTGFAFIRLNVLDSSYVRMGCNSAFVAFRLKLKKKCYAEYSTKFRTVLCGSGC